MNREQNSLSLAASWLRSAREVVVFTGAGVSAESGIPTFRDDEGFWQHFPVDEFATWKGLVRTAMRQPRRLAEFIHAVLQPIAAAKPNAGHRAIAEMEKHIGVTVVTQNIDNLHQEAGSTIVHEIHGSLFEVVTRRGRFVGLLLRRQLLQIAESLNRVGGAGWSCRACFWRFVRWRDSVCEGCIFPGSSSSAMPWPSRPGRALGSARDTATA